MIFPEREPVALATGRFGLHADAVEQVDAAIRSAVKAKLRKAFGSRMAARARSTGSKKPEKLTKSEPEGWPSGLRHRS